MQSAEWNVLYLLATRHQGSQIQSIAFPTQYYRDQAKRKQEADGS